MDKSPLFFGKTMTQRWDAPEGEYGVLYLGFDQFCAFMESIGRGVLKTRLVPSAMVQQKGLSKVRFTRSLRLIDLISSGGLTRIGVESSLSSGRGYKNSQRWSKASWMFGGVRGALSHIRSIPKSAALNKRLAERKLSMPVLAIGSELSYGDHMAEGAHRFAEDVAGAVAQ